MKIKKLCKTCNKEFYVFPSHQKHKFCSRKCFGMWGRTRLGIKSPGWNGGKIKQNCPNCNKTFLMWPFKGLTQNLHFCSRKCLGSWRSENFSGKNSPLWKGGEIIKKCLLCKKEFLTAPARLKQKRGIFCSRSCRSLWTIKYSKTRNTSIEVIIKNILKDLNINFVSQKEIPEGKTVADFYIPEQRLVIYTDGTFWHSLPGKKSKDCNQDFLLGMNGYTVLRLSEHDINNNINLCLRKIKKLSKIK